MDIRRISSTRWWNKRKVWTLIIGFFFLIFLRISKGTLYRDFYYLISKPFWPGNFQRELLLKNSTKELNIKLRQLEKDNLRLRELLSLQGLNEINTINASVISRKASGWWNKLILNRGQRDGVKIGDAVMGPGGLLGVVDNTTLFTSSIKLLTSNDSKVGVWAERTNKHGLLIGLGNDYPKLIFFSKNVDVKIGDIILSSPASTLLPPNVPIGIIESVRNDSDPVVSAHVQLIANPEVIDWVQISQSEI